MAEEFDVVGSGWQFPLTIDKRGGIALTQQYDQEIEQAIEIIINTPVGSRLMRPQFGCRIHEMLFAPINASTLATVAHYVEEALGYWEPRIDLIDVLVSPHPDMYSCILISIVYRIRATHDERALVYPFYTIPDED
jgi:phage baseplate assembly protein W